MGQRCNVTIKEIKSFSNDENRKTSSKLHNSKILKNQRTSIGKWIWD